MSLAYAHLNHSPDRLDVIDQYRGFAILLMVLADYLSRVQRVPAWLKHAPGTGLTMVDLIAPVFIFAIGLLYRPSWDRRFERDGPRQTITHFIRRNLALIGIGFLTPWGYSWGLFQTIGGAGIITLLVIWLPWRVRLIFGSILLGGYQYLSNTVWLGRVSPGSSWCEMEGTLSWAAMLILATVLADWYYNASRRRGILFLGSLAILGAGILLSNWVIISQYHVSASYVLIGLGASGFLFAGFDQVTEKFKIQIPLLSSWGKNPLLLYLLHYWIWVLVFLRPEVRGWHIEAPWWLIILQASGFVGLISLIAGYLDRRNWIISL
jgi:predicted acyltransferase